MTKQKKETTRSGKNKSKPTVEVTGDLSNALDFKDIKGNVLVKRALEIAAAGLHHILLIGPQGCGKTALAKAIYWILPDMSEFETSNMSSIYEYAGLLKEGQQISCRPFRSISPYHTLSVSPKPEPEIPFIQVKENDKKKEGLRILEEEISLSKSGILFADDLHEFEGPLQGILKKAIDTDWCESMLAATSIPIKGYDFLSMDPSTFPPQYAKISESLLDCIDIRLSIDPIPVIGEIIEGSSKTVLVDDSAAVKKRVAKAWEIQMNRYKEFSGVRVKKLNGQLLNRWIEPICPLSDGCEDLLRIALERMGLSIRSYYKLLKLSRTIADLDDSMFIHPVHLQEALQYRDLRWEKWMKREDRNEKVIKIGSGKDKDMAEQDLIREEEKQELQIKIEEKKETR